MVSIGASKIDRSVYNNILEDFIVCAEEHKLLSENIEVQRHMASAIFHGSMDIVRYLAKHYGVRPSNIWDDMSHINSSIVFGQSQIVRFFLDCGAKLEEASGETPSSLHLVNRRDDADLATLLCDHLQNCGSLATVMESQCTEGPLSGWTPAYTAMASRAWKNLEVLLRHGANPNAGCSGDESSLITLAVKPSSPAVPLSILQLLLDKGVDVNFTSSYLDTPIMLAIRSSNLLAVFHLVLHGARHLAALKDAEENEEDLKTSTLPVLDVNGNVSPKGWENMSEATSVIVTLLRIGIQGRANWKQQLNTTVDQASADSKGKMWILNANPTSYMIEVKVSQTG